MLPNKLKELRRARGLTLEELAERIGTSRQTIHRYENGIITNIPPDKVVSLAEALGTTPSSLMGWESDDIFGRYDNIMPISTKGLPILGSISCGKPIYAEEEHESFAATGTNLDADFCLRAVGDSMIGARIFDGDIVFIRRQPSVDDGEIAAVLIEDEATLKRVYITDESVTLISENPKYKPMVYTKKQCKNIRILGKAVACHTTL